MRVLLIGVGTVGGAIARLAATHPWCEAMILADHDTARDGIHWGMVEMEPGLHQPT
jgi:hypothetical protein